MFEFFDIFSIPFMQRALIVGVLLGGLASYLGVFIVQRRLSFLGEGLAHAAFGGVALGLLLRTEPLLIAVPFTILVALGINFVKDHAKISGDAAIGVFFASSMALGVVFLSLKVDYTTDALAYIFGSILTVGEEDVIASIVLALSAFMTIPWWRRWAYASFDRDLAIADRVPVRMDDYILSAYTALTVVLSVKILGVVLVSAFLVIPAVTTRIFARSFSQLCLASLIFGVLTSMLGLVVSYETDLPSGAVIVLLQASLFFLQLIFSRKIFR